MSSVEPKTTNVKEGILPSNVEIASGIEKVEKTLDERKSELSEHGKKLAEGTKEVLESAKHFIEEKNKGDVIQKLVKEGVEISKDMTGATEKITPDTTGIKEEVKDTFSYIRDIALLIIKSDEFRDLINNAVEILKDMQNKLWKKHEGTIEKKGIKETAKEVSKEIKEGLVIDEEQKKEIIHRFNDLLTKIGKDEQYKTAVNDFMKLLDHLNEKWQEAQQKGKEVIPNEKLEKMLQHSKQLLCNFGGEEATNQMTDNFYNFYNKIYNDEKGKQYINNLMDYVKRIIENPSDIDKAMDDINNLIDRAEQWIMSEEYKQLFNDWLDSFNQLLENIKNDKSLSTFNEKLTNLLKDMTLDEKGKPDIFVMQESLSQIKNIIVPFIKEEFANIPVSEIKGSTDNYDFKLENFTLNVGDILPETMRLRALSDLHINTGGKKEDKLLMKILFDASEMKTKIDGAKFWYLRKSTPSIEDYGIANIEVGGDGLSVHLCWRLYAESGMTPQLQLTNCDVSIDQLRLEIVEAKHSFIDRIITTLFSGYIKDQVQRGIEERLRQALEPINKQMNELFLTARRKIDTKMTVDTTNIAERANVMLKDTYDKLQHPEETKEEIKEKVIETAEKGLGKLKEVTGMGEETVEQIREGVKGISKKVEEKGITETIKEEGAKLAESVEQKGPEYVESAKETVEKGMEKVGEFAEEAKEKTGEFVEKAKEKGEKVLEKAPASEETKKQIKETGKELEKKGKEGFEQIQQLGQEVLESGKKELDKQSGEMAEKAKKKSDEYAEKAKEKGEELLDKTQEKTGMSEETKEKIKEKGKETIDTTKEKGKEKVEKAKEKGKEIAGKEPKREMIV